MIWGYPDSLVCSGFDGNFLRISWADGTTVSYSAGDGSVAVQFDQVARTVSAETQCAGSAGQSIDDSNYFTQYETINSTTTPVSTELAAQAQQNIYNGFVVFFIAFICLVWLLKKKS